MNLYFVKGEGEVGVLALAPSLILGPNGHFSFGQLVSGRWWDDKGKPPALVVSSSLVWTHP